MSQEAVTRAKEHFGKLLEKQLQRIEKMKQEPEWIDYAKLTPIRIGILGGDGIGPFIADEARRVLEVLLESEIKSGRVVFNTIEGMTIERRAEENCAIPPAVLEE